MGNNQFLSIGAIVLLALISLRFNTTVLQNRTTEIENKVYLTAFSLADDLIEEIKQKAFDEQTVDFHAINTEDLTPINLFAPDVRDAGENEYPTTWDDIDDYNGYSKSISLPHVENYSVFSTVEYVTATDPDVTSSSQTYFKKITVKVTSPYISHPVRLSFIFTLHSK